MPIHILVPEDVRRIRLRKSFSQSPRRQRCTVSGSDPTRHELTRSLAELQVKPWVEQAHESFYITNATIIDPARGELKDGMHSIKIEKGVITSVELQAGAVLEDGMEQVDVKGKYVCPGLIDAHVHVCAVPGVSVRVTEACLIAG